MIPRDENDCLLISPEEFTGTKWQYYRPLLFLADNMGKSRNSYNHYDDNSYELLQQFEPAIEIPSDDEVELKNHDIDSKSGLSPKLHQRLTKVKNEASPTENSSPSSSPPPHTKSNSSRLPPKLRAIPHMNLMEVQGSFMIVKNDNTFIYNNLKFLKLKNSSPCKIDSWTSRPNHYLTSSNATSIEHQPPEPE